MSHPWYHAKSSARLFGGDASDYVALHSDADATKIAFSTNLHRLVLHNRDFGAGVLAGLHGETLMRVSDGIGFPTREIVAQHCAEDYGTLVPTLAQCMAPHPRLQGERVALGDLEGDIISRLVRKMGGQASDYESLVSFLVQPALILGDRRAFGLLGNSFGIFLAERRVGVLLRRTSDGRALPTRYVAEHAVKAESGHITTIEAFFAGLSISRLRGADAWMRGTPLPLSDEFEEDREDVACEGAIPPSIVIAESRRLHHQWLHHQSTQLQAVSLTESGAMPRH